VPLLLAESLSVLKFSGRQFGPQTRTEPPAFFFVDESHVANPFEAKVHRSEVSSACVVGLDVGS
jgi:hypothetical protein